MRWNKNLEFLWKQHFKFIVENNKIRDVWFEPLIVVSYRDEEGENKKTKDVDLSPFINWQLKGGTKWDALKLASGLARLSDVVTPRHPS